LGERGALDLSEVLQQIRGLQPAVPKDGAEGKLEALDIAPRRAQHGPQRKASVLARGAVNCGERAHRCHQLSHSGATS
jgi:hypothetical protein